MKNERKKCRKQIKRERKRKMLRGKENEVKEYDRKKSLEKQGKESNIMIKSQRKQRKKVV